MPDCPDDRRDHAFRVEVAPSGARRPARAARRAHAGPIRSPDRLGLRHRPRVPAGSLRDWRTTFDWRAQEDAVQPVAALPHRDRRAADPLHPRRARDEPDALPLVITHGWPGSVAEFLDIIEPLATARRRRSPTFVSCRRCPATDGRARRPQPGWDVQRVAEAWKVLMARLGYERYGAQGGDWGAMISHASSARRSRARRRAAPQHAARRSPTTRAASSSPTTRAPTSRAIGEFMKTGAAYQEIQGKNPQTLGYGLTDSPAGLAGWIVEKFHALDRQRRQTRRRGDPRSDPHQPHRLLGDRARSTRRSASTASRSAAAASGRSASTSRCRPRPRVFPKEMFRDPAGVRRDRASTSSATPASTAAATSPRSRSPTCWSTTSRAFFDSELRR